MKIRFNKKDKSYFWFAQCYQVHFSFDDPNPYEHCSELFNKWWKLEGSSIEDEDDNIIVLAMDFIERELKVWLEEQEAKWAVRNLLTTTIKNPSKK